MGLREKLKLIWLRFNDVQTLRRAAFLLMFTWMMGWIFFSELSQHIGFGFDTQAPQDRCLPAQLFFVHKTDRTFEPGDLVYFVGGQHMHIPALPKNQQPFEKSYIAKMVVAQAGDTINIRSDQVRINGVTLSERVRQVDTRGWVLRREGLSKDTIRRAGLNLSDLEKTYVLKQGEIFVIGTELPSYDSRYWGPLPVERVLGKAYALL